jgi:sentrin-specific protease 1
MNAYFKMLDVHHEGKHKGPCHMYFSICSDLVYNHFVFFDLDFVESCFLLLYIGKEFHASGTGTSNKTQHFFTSFLTKSLMRDGYKYSSVKRWTNRIDVFALERFFFPVHIGGNHWSLAIVNIREKFIQICDSYGGVNDEFVFRVLKQYLYDEMLDKKKEQFKWFEDRWRYIGTDLNSTPQQRVDSDDCGVFTLMYADFIADNLPLQFGMQDIVNFRYKIASSILRGSIHPQSA